MFFSEKNTVFVKFLAPSLSLATGGRRGKRKEFPPPPSSSSDDNGLTSYNYALRSQNPIFPSRELSISDPLLVCLALVRALPAEGKIKTFSSLGISGTLSRREFGSRRRIVVSFARFPK